MNSRKSKRNFKRLVLGDVIEIPLPSGGCAYAQYVNYHRGSTGWGHLIRVLPGIFGSRPEDLESLVRQRERFFAFFPAGPAVSRGMVKIVSHEDIPEWARKLPLFKACNRNLETGKKTWFLWDGKQTQALGELPEEYYNLPLEQLVGFDVLVERIETGWSPRDEIHDAPPRLSHSVRRRQE